MMHCAVFWYLNNIYVWLKNYLKFDADWGNSEHITYSINKRKAGYIYVNVFVTMFASSYQDTNINWRELFMWGQANMMVDQQKCDPIPIVKSKGKGLCQVLMRDFLGFSGWGPEDCAAWGFNISNGGLQCSHGRMAEKPGGSMTGENNVPNLNRFGVL